MEKKVKLSKPKTIAPGIRVREHPNRKTSGLPCSDDYKGKKDLYWSLRCRVNGRLIEEGLGWSSQGINLSKAKDTLADLREGQRIGKGARTLQERRKEREEAEQKQNEIPSFSEVTDTWLKVKHASIRYSTHQQYWGHVKNHLKPFCGETPINKISYDLAEQFISHCDEKGMTIATTRKVLTTMIAIMRYAARKRYISHNPIRDIEKPQSTELKEDADRHFLTRDQVKQLLDSVTDLKKKTILMTAVLTGLRGGELLGLKWEDINWDTQQIHVKRTWNHGRWLSPKSKTSIRKVDIGPRLIAQLKEWKLACPPSKLDLVFPTSIGTPMENNNMVKRVFLPALKKAKLPRIRFHDLRHTYGSLLIDQGESLKYIQSQMGHSSINVTVDIYGHLLKDTNEAAPKRLEGDIFGSMEKGNKMTKNL